MKLQTSNLKIKKFTIQFGYGHLVIGIYLVIGIWLLVFQMSSFAQEMGDLVLKQGIGVRAVGMGRAFAAVADDASALFFNPAGLAEPGISYTYGSLDSEQKNNDFTFSFLKLGYLGYADGHLKNPSGDEISFTALGFSNRSGWFNWGSNYKALEWNLSGVQSSGWSADLGMLIRLTPELKLGLVAQDVLTTKERIVPASARVGLAFKPFDGQILLAADAEIYKSRPNYGHLGLEAKLAEGFTLRAGLDRGSPTLGASLNLLTFILDYAATFPSNGSNIYAFEAGVKFFPQKKRPFSLIKPKEFVLIDLEGVIKGGQTEVSLLGGVRWGLDSILERIRNAAKDKTIDGLVIRIRGFEGGIGGMAVVQELRAELLRAKEKGKKVLAYVEGSAVGDEYYLASVADKIIAAPGSAIGGFGKSLALYRASGLFEKLGIEWQIFSKGKYKTAFDSLSPRMSKEQKEMVEGLVANLYRQMLTDIAQSRKMKIEKLKEIGDGMIFPAKLAQKMGLVDEVGYLYDVCSVAASVCGVSGEVRIVEPSLVEPEEVFFTQVFGVAVIEIQGEIVSGASGQNFIFGGGYTGSDKVAADIRKAADDVFIKAIILRIDSPGGSAVAAGEIYRALQYAKEKKKVVIASLGGVGASGAYYIAAAADKIVADASTITGSIGVLGAVPVFAQLMKNLEVTAEVVKEGSHADMFSGLRKLSSVEVMALNRLLDETYQEFIRVVAEGRKLSTEEVEAGAEGKVYTGAQALELKLIDKIGGFMDAVDLAKEEAKIIGEPRLVYYRETSPFIQLGETITSSLGIFLKTQ